MEFIGAALIIVLGALAIALRICDTVDKSRQVTYDTANRICSCVEKVMKDLVP